MLKGSTGAALTVEVRPIEAMVPYARNARTHSDAQIAQIAASISEFGWTNPILVDGENGIIAGHGRLAAARKLGLTEVPVIELSHLTPDQKRAYIIADNKLALNAGWDEALLATDLSELAATEFDLSLTGFNETELERILAGGETLGEGDDQKSIDYREAFAVIVELDGEREQAGLLKRLTDEGYKCKALVS